MMSTVKFLAGVGVGVLITPLAAMLAVRSAGAGHGHYDLARLFFPYSMLLTRLADDVLAWPLLVLALVQFPLYGAILGITGSKRSAAVAGVLLLVAHFISVVFCFSGAIPNFS